MSSELNIMASIPQRLQNLSSGHCDFCTDEVVDILAVFLILHLDSRQIRIGRFILLNLRDFGGQEEVSVKIPFCQY